MALSSHAKIYFEVGVSKHLATFAGHCRILVYNLVLCIILIRIIHDKGDYKNNPLYSINDPFSLILRL